MEQQELIAEHLLNGAQLYVSPAERMRLIRVVYNKHPDHKILSAELDLENCTWNLELVKHTT